MLTFDDAALSYARLSGLSFSEAQSRMRAALLKVSSTEMATAAAGLALRIASSFPARSLLFVPQPPRRTRPPRRLARRAHAKRMARRSA